MTAGERTQKLLLEIALSDSKALWPYRYSSRDFQRRLEMSGIFLPVEAIETTLHRLVNRGELVWRAFDDIRYQITEDGLKRLADLQASAISAAEVA